MGTRLMQGLTSGLAALMLLTLAFTPTGAPAASSWSVTRANVDEILFLIPDDLANTDPRVKVWLDAGREEGLHLRAMRDSDFMGLGTGAKSYVGVIMPDQVHLSASDALVSALRSYVSAGGKLMLVYDSGVLTSSGFYASPKSRFSDMVGVDYALYDSLRDYTIGFGHVTGARSVLRTLGVPPGKSMPYPDSLLAGSTEPQFVPPTTSEPSGLTPKSKAPRPLKKRGETFDQGGDDSHLALRRIKATSKTKKPGKQPDDLQGISGYFYGFLGYPSFVTQGDPGGTVLLGSPDHGVVASINRYGAGQVLFVNTPLGYLKGYGTDGLLLHGFLRHFAVNLLQQPSLANVPAATGGLVLNVHTDAAEALPALASLDAMGVWNNGPFSVHLTAGPDTINFGDSLGLNVPGNPLTQSWIRYLDAKGHQIGSHGGWIHDWFAANLTEDNQADMEKYLVWNKSALEAVTGKPVVEYSAPAGNMPKWVVTWAEQNGMLGYYFVGNTGMSPTRSYREGVVADQQIWSFPITPYGKAATFEDFSELGISGTEATQWFTELTDFVVQRSTARLIYFHPPGAENYSASVKVLLSRATTLRQRGDFDWYTMADLASFLSARDRVTWKAYALGDSAIGVEAVHPISLSDQAWVFPGARYEKPVVVAVNDGSIVAADDASASADWDKKNYKGKRNVRVIWDATMNAWVVTVPATGSAVKSLRFTARLLAQK